MFACGDGEKPEPKQGDVDSDGVNYLTVSVYFAGTLSCFCMRCTTPLLRKVRHKDGNQRIRQVNTSLPSSVVNQLRKWCVCSLYCSQLPWRVMRRRLGGEWQPDSWEFTNQWSASHSGWGRLHCTPTQQEGEWWSGPWLRNWPMIGPSLRAERPPWPDYIYHARMVHAAYQGGWGILASFVTSNMLRSFFLRSTEDSTSEDQRGGELYLEGCWLVEPGPDLSKPNWAGRFYLLHGCVLYCILSSYQHYIL